MKSILKKTAVGIIAGCLSACAALQIDVDVYKGPLSDQRDVQHEQLMSLADTSKKLLEDLQRQLMKDIRFTGEENFYFLKNDVTDSAVLDARRKYSVIGSVDKVKCESLNKRNWLLDRGIEGKSGVVSKLGMACALEDLISLFENEEGQNIINTKVKEISDNNLYFNYLKKDFNENLQMESSEKQGGIDGSKREKNLADIRKVVDKNIEETLQLLILLNNADNLTPQQKLARRDLSRGISGIINPQELAKAIEFYEKDGGRSLNRSEALNLTALKGEIDEAAEIVNSFLKSDQNAAIYLLEVRDLIRLQCASGLISGERLCESGFARGPTSSDSGSISELTIVGEGLKAAGKASLALGTLSRSRHPFGIFTLSKNYRDADQNDKEDALKDLHYMLLNYAGKLLVLADKQILFSNGSNGEIEASRQYTQVLQSIGSAIYVQINEIKAQSRAKQLRQEMDRQDLALAEQFFGRNPAIFKRSVLQALENDKAETLTLYNALTGANLRLDSWKINYDQLQSLGQKKDLAGYFEQGSLKALALLDSTTIAVSDNTRKASKDAVLLLFARYIDAFETTHQLQECTYKLEDLRRGCAPIRLIGSKLSNLTDDLLYFGADDLNKDERLLLLVNQLKLLHQENSEVQNKLAELLKNATETQGEAVKQLTDLLSSSEVAESCISGQGCKLLEDKMLSTNMLIKQLQNAIVHVTHAKFESETEPEQWLAALIKDAKPDFVVHIRTKASQVLNMSLIADFKCKYEHKGQAAECEPGYALKGVVRYLESLVIYLRSRGNDDELTHAKEALQLAHDLSARRQYLTPATAYLRSSYPSSAMQKNNSASDWQNMLSNGALRSIPLFGSLKANNNITQQQIDKQFWQNINTVRITGGGDTNYVVVKDDIGNWYVKGYSSDPKEIYQTVANVALYNVAGKAGYLLEQGNAALSLKGSANVLDAMYGRFFEKYTKATEAQFGVLKSWLDKDSWLEYAEKDCKDKTLTGMPSKKLKELQGSDAMKLHKDKFDGFTKVFSNIVNSENKMELDHKTAQQAAAITQLLSGTADYANSLLSTAHAKCEPGDALDKSVGIELYDNFVGKHKKQRQESLEEFEQQILFIREGLPENSPVQPISLN
ncbi:hypothetical protein ORJ04_20705 [Rheinheimera baltica]|uniref:Uncharacterized protein n=2 Tax=Rheinheimera baltica TaxID=67576 RepID=A0ABT9I4R3_9GAMM|nr:hypothetical protein [Rheinheimera baltica]MDP5138373.1 hypothetical protein [Rheinheimera baltica]MDP5150502.1 hypothetical protein [Rheinheimera baltica]